MNPFPSKLNALQRLKSFGVPIQCIIDVGAHEQTYELRMMFPDLPHLLFEPVKEFHPKIRENYEGMTFEIFPHAVSSHSGSGQLQTYSVDGGGVTHSSLTSTDDGSDSVSDVQTVRLDEFLAARSDPTPYLLKIDVDGYEVPIIESAAGARDDISCIIVEATIETLQERLIAVTALGFQLIDIIDSCYYHGVLSQVDLVFVSTAVYGLADLRPWQTKEFAWEHWRPVPDYEKHIPEDH